MTANSKSAGFTIVKSFSFQEIRWGAVLDILVEQYHLSPFAAQRMIHQLFERLSSPFEVYWFHTSKLSRDENRILAVLCSMYKTGVISITNQRRFDFGLFHADYYSRIRFAPDWAAFRNSSPGGTCIPEIGCRIFRMRTILTKTYQVALMRLILMSIGVFAYVFFIGGVLYCISVFVVFAQFPLATLREALSNPPIAVALLGCFVMITMVTGRIARILTNR